MDVIFVAQNPATTREHPG